MYYKHLLPIFILLVFSQFLSAQTAQPKDTIYDFEIDYTIPKKYQIAHIDVTGAETYEDFVLIGFSGLQVGQWITIPGDAITAAVKKFWNQSLFSDVRIYPTKAAGEKIWLTIELKVRPKVSEINYKGLKKSEIEDIGKRTGIVKEKQITPNMSARAEKNIRKYLDEKGFANADIKVLQKDDPAKPGNVLVDIEVDKKEKTKVHQIVIRGNENLSYTQLTRAMKKTNDNNILNLFRTKKFVKAEYEKDKIAFINKYNEKGYRDAYIVSDSVIPYNDKSVSVYLTVNEGKKYYFGDIRWVGNTVYPYETLNQVLNIKKGDVFNSKLLEDRLETDQNDAVAKLYRDRGYLFFRLDPVETAIRNDTIDYEVRMYEGMPATINKVTISGNTRVYEHVIRRELRTVPGRLYSQEEVIRSIRDLSAMKLFDEEKLGKDMQSGGIVPNPESGTVDLNYKVETKSSDQVEFSAGWGAAGLVGSLGLKFSNFAIQNLFKKDMYHNIVPQGEGQQFNISARTNGSYYTSASISFVEPWLGGKRPNSLSVSLYYSGTSDMSDRYYSAYQNMYNSMYSYGRYGGYGGYGGYNDLAMINEVDKNKYFRTIGASVGYGKRLDWPDDFFTFYGELSYQRFMMKNWRLESLMSDGVSNNFSINLVVGRNSTDNPFFTRRGSNYSLGLQITPPYSLFSKKTDAEYAKMSQADKFKFLEYHKWKFSAKNFIPLMSINKTPVLMGRAEFAYIGYFNKNLQTPFGTYMFGGDGMTGYAGYATEYISMRGYETGRLTPYQYVYDPAQGKQIPYRQVGYLYNKYTLELRVPISLEQNATIWGLAFLEAGNAFNRISDYNPFNLKRSAGIGVRIVLPMFGLMGIDWGYGFDSQIGDNKPHGGQFHFVIGQEL